ncbi:MAG: biotin--[acetyl-CoA-carboxylase] ligase [Janthinobacterium lividum]
MTEMMKAINPAEVNAGLRHARLGGHVLHFPEVESTNDLALAAAQAGQENGAWVADAQTAGRGRGGHTWHSVPGDGLYVSALFTPRLPAAALELSLAAGLAAWDAIREVAGITVDIRWPNDLVTRPVATGTQPTRKLGGVLVETAVASPIATGSAATLRYAVIGIGINVGHAAFPPELASVATSLRLEGWAVPDRQALLVAMLGRLDTYVTDLEETYGGLKPRSETLARLPEASTWLAGKRVRVPEDGGYTGTTAGLDPSGFLLVNSDTGELRTVRSGGVREL